MAYDFQVVADAARPHELADWWAKTVKDRWHLDVFVGTENVPTVTEQLTARGATFLHNGQQGPRTWVTMADPEGNEFCLS
jgi:hypothetical protein